LTEVIPGLKGGSELLQSLGPRMIDRNILAQPDTDMMSNVETTLLFIEQRKVQQSLVCRVFQLGPIQKAVDLVFER